MTVTPIWNVISLSKRKVLVSAGPNVGLPETDRLRGRPRDRACQNITHTHILVIAFPQNLLGFPICNQESAYTALPVLFQALRLALIASSLLNLKLITIAHCLDPQPIKGGRRGTMWVILKYPLVLISNIIPQ